MQIITRDQWGAAAPTGPLDAWPGGQPTSWTLHYEGVDIDPDLPDYADRVRSIQGFHQRNGYYDIAYNWLISGTGLIYEGRGWDLRSAAQSNGNRTSMAVCYLGGPNTPLTDAAKAAINWLIGQRPMDVLPHRHWIATACPGEQVSLWLDAGRPDAGGIPPAPPAPLPSRPETPAMIRPGARGDQVARMQSRLLAHGFDPQGVDGIYGPNTGAALRAFQGARGIGVDGICGPITWSHLDQPAAGAQRNLSYGAVGDDVKVVQSALAGHGVNPGAVDGIFGPRTDGAVRVFQSLRGLDVDGIVGPQTRGALGI